MDVLQNAGLYLLVGAFIAAQLFYAATFLLEAYFASLPINWVSDPPPDDLTEDEYPFIVLFYPVLKELEETMETAFTSLAKIDYPKHRYRIVSIPNSNDHETIASLRRLQKKFEFLQIIEVPPTSDPSWNVVWDAWDRNEKAYWWHKGERAGVRDLPPKKTRQLIYSFYHIENQLGHEPDLAINYIDADSCVPVDHFKAAVMGLRQYDVLQAQNVCGNLNATLASTFHAFDHMAWDGKKYPHLTANGRQPFWVLGKGLFFRASDLVDLGGFHPWIAIEDPEVGLRFWKNGKRLGVISSPLIEEVPETFKEGVTQRKRWVCGFFQTLTQPLHDMGFTPWERFKARLNFLPCLSLWVNLIGIPTGIWAAWSYMSGQNIVPAWTFWLAVFNLTAFIVVMAGLYWSTWKRTALVCDRWVDRAWYMLRINPLFAMLWWAFWAVPLAIGFFMYRGSGGLVWQRTEKVDANNQLVRQKLERLRAAV